MTVTPSDYVFDSADECGRLERQAALQGIERHLRHLQVRPGMRILDAGCGSGAMARLLAARHPEARVVGIDLNPAYIAFARDRAAAVGLANLSFETGDIQDLPFVDASFDIVWSHLVLFFLPHPAAALRAFRRVLRPGGTALIALHERTLMTHYPEDTDLQARLERVMPALADVLLARKLPLMLRAAGFGGIAVEIEADSLYTILGPVDPARRRNVADVLTPALPHIAAILGGPAQAEAFLADLLAYLDRADTCSYTALWIARGVVAP